MTFAWKVISPGSRSLLVNGQVCQVVIIPPRNEVRGGVILESPCPSVRLSVRLSVDARLGKMVSSAINASPLHLSS